MNTKRLANTAIKIKEGPLHHTQSAIAVLNSNYELIDASNSLCSLVGIEAEALRGTNWFRVFPNLSKDWKIKLDHTLHGVKNIVITDSVTAANGEINNYVWHLNPWNDVSGKQYGIAITIAPE